MLNEEFYDTFTDEEKSFIIESKVKNTSGGKDASDRLFLLSSKEAERYFEDEWDRRACGPDAFNNDYSDRSWWLRSSRDKNCAASFVLYNGNIMYDVQSVKNYNIGVRPVCWVDISEQSNY